MQTTLDKLKEPPRDDRLHVPAKVEILDARQADSSRIGLQLEWMLDRCAAREGSE